MYSILLGLIYLIFVSLGLPDSLLGSAWPSIRQDFGVPLGYASIISMVISGCTIVSSLFSNKLTKHIGEGLIATISVTLTAIALLGFSLSNSFTFMLIMSLPYGLGAGAVDSILNNYIATHYSSKHMNWLHCFLGIGSALSPIIMSYALSNTLGWSGGYLIVFIIQISISAILFTTLPLWKINSNNNRNINSTEQISNSIDYNTYNLNLTCKNIDDTNNTHIDPPLKYNLHINNTNSKTSQSDTPLLQKTGIIKAFKTKGVLIVLIGFFAYCALEAIVSLYATSYFVIFRNIRTETAALFSSLFFIGITVGRFLSGFISIKLSDKNIIRLGSIIILIGTIAILIPTNNTTLLAQVGLIITGLGCAPIFPAIIHSTPSNFGKNNSQSIISLQFASAYAGSSVMPPIFGLVVTYMDIYIFPYALLLLGIVVIFSCEMLNKIVSPQASRQ